jgi:hypothetical protein
MAEDMLPSYHDLSYKRLCSSSKPCCDQACLSRVAWLWHGATSKLGFRGLLMTLSSTNAAERAKGIEPSRPAWKAADHSSLNCCGPGQARLKVTMGDRESLQLTSLTGT